MAAGVPPAAMAQVPDSFLDALDLSTTQEARTDFARVQSDLAWLGLYLKPIDGRRNADATDAIRLFQQGLNAAATGTLSDDQRSVLSQRARQTQIGYGFQRHQIEWLGISADLPLSIMGRPSLAGETWNFIDYQTFHSSNMVMEFSVFEVQATGEDFLRTRLDAFKENDEKTRVLASGSTGSAFFGAYAYSGRRVLMLGQRQGEQWKRLLLFYDLNDHDAMRPFLNRILHSIDFFAGRALNATQRRESIRAGRYPGSDATPSWFRSMIANGSGSIVSRDGHVLTNHHVTSGCGRVTVNGTEARVIGSDVRLDLALIEAPSLVGRRPVRFRESNPDLGERIAVLGYPVFGVSQSLNFTSGFVSSAVGFRGDRTRVQVTAPIQPGNSGGPVVDTNGAQVAVVASKASAAFQTNSNVENIGWVIRGRQAVQFLERFGLRPSMETRKPPENMPGPDLIQDWRKFTLRIECHSR